MYAINKKSQFNPYMLYACIVSRFLVCEIKNVYICITYNRINVFMCYLFYNTYSDYIFCFSLFVLFIEVFYTFDINSNSNIHG